MCRSVCSCGVSVCSAEGSPRRGGRQEKAKDVRALGSRSPQSGARHPPLLLLWAQVPP
jgi:hypothetical protein